MRSNRILERFSGGRSIPRLMHPQRSILNQSRRDRAARDTIGVHALPQLEGELVSGTGERLHLVGGFRL